ncbi:hypothetical protein ACTI_73350 [Actinoplanes sp. OR16]|uniref:permease-like cell division protein FtsX n=1 Tax=Actinoplanes sp. OR16 TaxID=946334 RepID=UPI000F6BCE2C|nr:permease-like cell division protein FtsX [Actinoplanes sp. OR16]BBH70650.1 hypothetical protein ACTI_73350 [Actinoplanes sp. OR16]
MEPDLRQQFDVAVSADPGADPGEMARSAIARVGRIRQRRRLAMAGSAAAAVVAVVAAVGVLKVTDGAAPPAGRQEIIEAGMRLAAPQCSADPVSTGATDAAIFLGDPTARELAAVGRALDDDERVAAVIFESRAEAYAKFTEHWKDAPDFLAAVGPEQMPVSYRLRLADPDRFAELSRDYAGKPGVGQIVGRVCPASAPVGGVL